jgi:hypothetical protein
MIWWDTKMLKLNFALEKINEFFNAVIWENFLGGKKELFW